MQKRRQPLSLGGAALISAYIIFMFFVVAYACRQHRVHLHPMTFEDSVRSVLKDTNNLHDPNPDSLRKTLEDTTILNHSEIKPNL